MYVVPGQHDPTLTTRHAHARTWRTPLTDHRSGGECAIGKRLRAEHHVLQRVREPCTR